MGVQYASDRRGQPSGVMGRECASGYITWEGGGTAVKSSECMGNRGARNDINMSMRCGGMGGAKEG